MASDSNSCFPFTFLLFLRYDHGLIFQLIQRIFCLFVNHDVLWLVLWVIIISHSYRSPCYIHKNCNSVLRGSIIVMWSHTQNWHVLVLFALPYTRHPYTTKNEEINWESVHFTTLSFNYSKHSSPRLQSVSLDSLHNILDLISLIRCTAGKQRPRRSPKGVPKIAESRSDQTGSDV
jgi:hypothetical protein